MLPYRILIHPEAYQKAEAYRIYLVTNGINEAGLYLQRELQGKALAKHGETVLNFLTSVSQYNFSRILRHS